MLDPASLGLVERVAALHRVDLFAGVPGRVLAAVAEAAAEVRAPPGDLLIDEGAVEAHLYAVVEGRVRVHRGDQTLVELGPGTTVGELAALVPQPRTASVTALEPTLVLRLDKAVLDDLLADWPELADGVIAALVARLRAAADHAGRDAVNSTPPRGVVGLLTAQALAFGVTLALLLVPANSLFLDAYGSEWLPATYIAIAVVGSGGVRAHRPGGAADAPRADRDGEPRRPRGALRRVLGDPRRRRRLGVGGPARHVPDRPPGRVRVHRRAGGPAARRAPDEGAVPARRVGIRGRVLPRRRCSAYPLLALLGSTENLLLATTAAQLAFLGLLLVTERRFPEVRAAPAADAPAVVRPPLRTLFARAWRRCCSSTRCCPRWGRRWSTSCCSTAPRRGTAATT